MRRHSERLGYAEPDAIGNALDYAKFYSRSDDAVIAFTMERTKRRIQGVLFVLDNEGRL